MAQAPQESWHALVVSKTYLYTSLACVIDGSLNSHCHSIVWTCPCTYREFTPQHAPTRTDRQIHQHAPARTNARHHVRRHAGTRTVRKPCNTRRHGPTGRVTDTLQHAPTRGITCADTPEHGLWEKPCDAHRHERGLHQQIQQQCGTKRAVTKHAITNTPGLTRTTPVLCYNILWHHDIIL